MKTILFSLIGFMALTQMSLVQAGKLEIINCSKSEKKKIKEAISWLKGNISQIDRQMGRNKLMDWPGNSRKKFIAKLDKNLKVRCDNEKRKCREKEIKDDGKVVAIKTLRGRVVPILHQKRITLCAQYLTEDADYVSVLAHEIAHLVRLNAHRTKCKNKFTKPRYSQSVGLAAYHAKDGTDYDSSKYLSRNCP